MRRLAVWAVSWVALAALWLLYQGEWNAIQLYAAGSAGALSLLVAWVVRRHSLPAIRVERRWVVPIARIPWQVLREFILITRFLFRAVRGDADEGLFHAHPFPVGGPRPAERGRRAVVALATGYSPNSYVLDVDEERRLVLVHVLSPVPREEELV